MPSLLAQIVINAFYDNQHWDLTIPSQDGNTPSVVKSFDNSTSMMGYVMTILWRDHEATCRNIWNDFLQFFNMHGQAAVDPAALVNRLFIATGHAHRPIVTRVPTVERHVPVNIEADNAGQDIFASLEAQPDNMTSTFHDFATYGQSQTDQTLADRSIGTNTTIKEMFRSQAEHVEQVEALNTVGEVIDPDTIPCGITMTDQEREDSDRRFQETLSRPYTHGGPVLPPTPDWSRLENNRTWTLPPVPRMSIAESTAAAAAAETAAQDNATVAAAPVAITTANPAVPHVPAAPATARDPNRSYCEHPGCNKHYSRQADMIRHCKNAHDYDPRSA